MVGIDVGIAGGLTFKSIKKLCSGKKSSSMGRERAASWKFVFPLAVHIQFQVHIGFLCDSVFLLAILIHDVPVDLTFKKSVLY